MKRPAIFFDRDNTLIVSDGYLGDPAKVVLVSGAAEAVARARKLGFAAVVFSNQSGVARGMFSEEDVQAVNQRMDDLLRAQEPTAIIERHEYCPFHPQGTIDVYARESDRRKPGPGMIQSAARILALDLENSWVIGDAARDIEAGKVAGCRAVLFDDPTLAKSPAAEKESRLAPDFVAPTLAEALDFIEGQISGAATPSTATSISPESAPASTPVEAAPPQPDPQPLAPQPVPVAPLPVQPTPTPASAAAPAPAKASAAPSTPAATMPRVPKVVIGSKYVPPGGVKPETRSAPSAAAPARPVAPSMPAAATPATGATASAPAEPQGAASPTPVASSTPTERPVAKKAARDDVAPEPALSNPARVETLLEQIFLEMRRRNEGQEGDFSVSKLLAGIVQIIVLAVLLFAYLKRNNLGALDTTLTLALVLQTMTATLLIMSRQK